MGSNGFEIEQIGLAYDEQFQRYVMISRGFIGELTSKQDRQICVNWIQKLLRLKSPDIGVKRNRNQFFQYLLQVMQTAALSESLDIPQTSPLRHYNHEGVQDMDTIEDQNWLEEVLNIPDPIPPSSSRVPPYIAHWSDDQKTYTAAKALPGQGALIYMAVSKDPSQGWENLTE